MHPDISPLFRNDWQDLPPTHIITTEHDPLHDECSQLYQQLCSAGINAHRHHFPGVIHGFFQLSGISRSAREAIRLVARLVARLVTLPTTA